MPPTRHVVSWFIAFAALVVLAPANRLDGQIGGLIKKKVTESINGDKQEQASEKDQAAPGQNDGSKLPMKLTGNVLTAFEKGVEVERDHRRVTLKTPDEFNTCQRDLGASPEAQKIIMAPANLPASATAAQVQKATENVQPNLAKLLAEKCGENPHPYQGGWRQLQMEAAVAAGVKAFAAAMGGATGGGGPFLAFEQDQGQQREKDFYRLLKEWVPPFCNLPKSAQQAAADKGVQIPGNGKGVFFVYTAAEARLLMEKCAELMKLLSEII